MKSLSAAVVCLVAAAAGLSEAVHGQNSPEEEPIVRVVRTVRPAVVNIYTEAVVERQMRDPFDHFFDQFGGVPRARRIIRTPVRSLGSGVLFHPAGYIVTNQHVVARARDAKIRVILHDGGEHEAKLLRDDPDLDLALIQIEERGLPHLDITRLSPNLLGQTVVAIGNPIGYESSVSRGILSAKDRSLTIEGVTYDSLLQTDAAINPGNSGGPLLDISGNFVGLNSAKAGMGVENIGFAIPGERVLAFVEEAVAIAEGRKPEPPVVDLLALIQEKFGLTLQELDEDLARTFGLQPGAGLVVVRVEEDGPAAVAGIERGMLVNGIGAHRVRGAADIPRNVQKLGTDDTLRFNILLIQRRGPALMSRTVGVDLKAR